ncbi:hypothetical protein [Sporosarcina sp. P18a]|uniref:hypothetical protein n=1 Tax=Sporosarcina sp. P18a TaxID=2048259 RepID=UPI00130445C9|nr:hypothetical protein [Sporosarcina sp. P18a]
MEIMNAKDMQKITEFGKEEFEKAVISGLLFKDIVSFVENSALEGYQACVWTFEA